MCDGDLQLEKQLELICPLLLPGQTFLTVPTATSSGLAMEAALALAGQAQAASGSSAMFHPHLLCSLGKGVSRKELIARALGPLCRLHECGKPKLRLPIKAHLLCIQTFNRLLERKSLSLYLNKWAWKGSRRPRSSVESLTSYSSAMV